MSFWFIHFRSHLSHGIMCLYEIHPDESTAWVAFVDDNCEPVMEEKESPMYMALEVAGLGMSVVEVVVRLGKMVGNMLGLLGEETCKY